MKADQIQITFEYLDNYDITKVDVLRDVEELTRLKNPVCIVNIVEEDERVCGVIATVLLNEKG